MFRSAARRAWKRTVISSFAAVLTLAITAGAALGYNQYLYRSGTIGNSTGGVSCVNDHVTHATALVTRAPIVYSSTGSAQVVQTRQVFQKYVYSQSSRSWSWQTVARAPMRTHDYRVPMMDIQLDSYTVSSAGHYRVVTQIWWPTGYAEALYGHFVVDHAGVNYGGGPFDYCTY